MSQYVLCHEASHCTGCRACEMACKVNKALPEHVALCRIVTGTPSAATPMQVQPRFEQCYHCGEAWCVHACPTGAIVKRPEDGIVTIIAERCNGCRACIAACPWKRPQWDFEAGRVTKCDLCVDRLDAGKQPACVAHCTTGCLTLERAPDLSVRRREAYAKRVLGV